MKERKLMTSFLLANCADAATTAFSRYTNLAMELNPLLVDTERGMILKAASTAVLIGLYALAQEYGSGERGKYVTDKALRIGNGLVWLSVAWNIVNIAPEVINKIR